MHLIFAKIEVRDILIAKFLPTGIQHAKRLRIVLIDQHDQLLAAKTLHLSKVVGAVTKISPTDTTCFRVIAV